MQLFLLTSGVGELYLPLSPQLNSVTTTTNSTAFIINGLVRGLHGTSVIEITLLLHSPELFCQSQLAELPQ